MANALFSKFHHVLCICETWLTKEEVQNYDLNFDSEQNYRADRPLETNVIPHGNSLVAVKNSLDSETLDTALPDCCIACNIK